MKTVSCSDIKATLDDEGFLTDSAEWNEEVACLIAAEEGVELTEEMMSIIRFLRGYYYEYHAFPILRQVCRDIHQARGCIQDNFVDPMKAWKIAGLPHLVGVEFISTDPEGRIYETSTPG